LIELKSKKEMKRKSDLMERRNKKIFDDYQNLRKEGYKKSQIYKILVEKYFLAESTLERIIYNYLV